MKPKQRKRLLENKARKEAARLYTLCTQTSDNHALTGHDPTLTGHGCGHSGYDNYVSFVCSRCGQCYACMHEVIEREGAGSIKWWRCPDGFEKPSYLDHGQFAPLRNKLSSEGVSWERYGSA